MFFYFCKMNEFFFFIYPAGLWITRLRSLGLTTLIRVFTLMEFSHFRHGAKWNFHTFVMERIFTHSSWRKGQLSLPRTFPTEARTTWYQDRTPAPALEFSHSRHGEILLPNSSWHGIFALSSWEYLISIPGLPTEFPSFSQDRWVELHRPTSRATTKKR